MAQVNSENSTTTPADQTRRRFLTQSVLAGATAAVATSIAPPAMAAITRAADPIFAAIEAHKKARQATQAGIAEQHRLSPLADAAVGPRRIMIPDMLNIPGSSRRTARRLRHRGGATSTNTCRTTNTRR